MRNLILFTLLFYCFFASVAQNSLNDKKTFEVSKNQLLGKFNPATDKDFVLIDRKHTDKVGIYLRKEVYNAFLEMRDSAKKDGINLYISSAARTFEQQKYIWNSKWNSRKRVGNSIEEDKEIALSILKYSSMPGTSRHHWGTDIDINKNNPAYYQTEEGKKVLKWLEKNAAHFGFCRPYTDFGETRKTGFQPEEWHWSYVSIANIFLENYKKQINYVDIEGFEGDEMAFPVRVIDNYVFGIDEKCFK